MQKGAKTGRSGIHLHSYWFVLLLLCFFSENREQDGISRGQKETERESFKQQNPWVSVPQGSVWLPCGCNVFVRPSPLITIMSLERSMRAGFVCSCVLSASECRGDNTTAIIMWREKCHILTFSCWLERKLMREHWERTGTVKVQTVKQRQWAERH